MAGKKRCEKINPAESLSKLQSHTLIWYLRIASYIAAPLLWHTSSSSTSETLEYALRIHFVIMLALSHPGRVTICSASGVYSEVGSRKRDSSGTQAVRKHNKGGSYTAHPESMRCAVIALMLDLRVSEMVDEKLVVIPT
jgi:hypothetical protein